MISQCQTTLKKFLPEQKYQTAAALLAASCVTTHKKVFFPTPFFLSDHQSFPQIKSNVKNKMQITEDITKQQYIEIRYKRYKEILQTATDGS